MATYSQYRQHADAGTVKRATWVQGAEHVLVEEVVDSVRILVGASDMDYVSQVVGEVKPRDVWAALNQYPSKPGAPRLVLVREAQRIKDWSPFKDWWENRRFLPTVHVCFVSSEAGVLDSEVEPLATIKGSGHLVRCSTPNEKDLLSWVRGFADGLDEHTAEYLVTRLGGNLAAVKNTALKCALFPGVVGTDVIDLLASEAPADDFALHLCHLRKDKALGALEVMHEQDHSKTIGLLDYNLDLLSKLNRGVRRKMTVAEMGKMAGVHHVQAVQYVGCAKHYDQERVAHCRRVLLVADSALRQGTHTGVMEMVAALW